MATCFVCDKKDADIWLPGPDVRVCSEEHMKLFLEEWIKQEDPLNQLGAASNSQEENNSSSEKS